MQWSVYSQSTASLANQCQALWKWLFRITSCSLQLLRGRSGRITCCWRHKAHYLSCGRKVLTRRRERLILTIGSIPKGHWSARGRTCLISRTQEQVWDTQLLTKPRMSLSRAWVYICWVSDSWRMFEECELHLRNCCTNWTLWRRIVCPMSRSIPSPRPATCALCKRLQRSILIYRLFVITRGPSRSRDVFCLLCVCYYIELNFEAAVRIRARGCSFTIDNTYCFRCNWKYDTDKCRPLLVISNAQFK